MALYSGATVKIHEPWQQQLKRYRALYKYTLLLLLLILLLLKRGKLCIFTGVAVGH